MADWLAIVIGIIAVILTIYSIAVTREMRSKRSLAFEKVTEASPILEK